MGSDAKLEPGDVFAGRYQVQRRLGEGDRKRTYLARDTKMDRLVAISLVRPEAIAADPDGTEREARVLGRIGSHPSIVSLHEFEVSRGGSVQYMVFQYLGGGTLAEYLKEAGRLPLQDVLRLGRQLCRGLSHLHKQGLVHRDVSPENVWLDEWKSAHLGDFDSAIPTGGAGELRPITTGAFASPEERGGGVVDTRSDLYSLGGVLHVIATGARYPGDLSLLREQRPDLPSAFADLMGSLLADFPAQRPASADAVLQRLDQVRHASNVETLIAAGESDTVEFKSSLHHPYEPLYDSAGKQVQPNAQREIRKQLGKSVTKTIAGFLNSQSGGTLLIGVDDSGSALGIEADFEHLKKGKQTSDGWLLSLKETIIQAVGADVWNAVSVSLVTHSQKTVAVVNCPPRTRETWHRDGAEERFYIRASNATEALTGSGLVNYIRERFPARP